MIISHYKRLKAISDMTGNSIMHTYITYQTKSLEYILRDRRNNKLSLPIVQYTRALEVMEAYAKRKG